MNIENLDEVICDECKNKTFTQIYSMRKMSALVAPNGQQTYVPVVEGFACTECGHINKEFRPDEDDNEDKDTPKSSIITP